MNNLQNVIDTSVLGNVRFLKIDRCNNIVHFPIPSGTCQRWSLNSVPIIDLSGYENLIGLDLFSCKLLKDISMLGKVQNLTIWGCSEIIHFPQPIGKDQSWNLYNLSISDLSNYSTLGSLSISSCYNIVDISMLGAIKHLTVTDCPNIIHFPIPTGKYQEWIFNNCSISNLSGYHGMYMLELICCDKITDLSPLYNINIVSIIDCDFIPQIMGLKGIESLKITGCTGLKYIDHKGHLSVEKY